MTLSQLLPQLEGIPGALFSEDTLQCKIATLLDGLGLEYQREARLSARDRVDFLVRMGVIRVAIEVKVAGSRHGLLRQVARYCAHDEVDAVVVVTNLTRHTGLPEQLGGKPVRVALLLGGAF